jgi:hypothetical protein
MLRNKKAFTTVEVLVSSVIIVLIFASTIGTFILVKSVSREWIAEVNVQQTCSALALKIIRGNSEEGNFVGLRSARSFTLPVVVPAGSRIDYVGADGNTRSYFLNGNTIQYISPTQSPNQQAVYSAQASQAVTLTFWEPAGISDHQTVGIQVSVSQAEPPVTGRVTTYINLRNMPK